MVRISSPVGIYGSICFGDNAGSRPNHSFIYQLMPIRIMHLVSHHGENHHDRHGRLCSICILPNSTPSTKICNTFTAVNDQFFCNASPYCAVVLLFSFRAIQNGGMAYFPLWPNQPGTRFVITHTIFSGLSAPDVTFCGLWRFKL